jgi:hypothetical protein
MDQTLPCGSPSFFGPEDSLPCSAGPYTEEDEFNPHTLPFSFIDIHYNNNLIIMTSFLECSPFIIIIFGKTALFEPQPSLEASVRLHPVFTSLHFAIVFFFIEQLRQPCVQPPTWRTRSLYLCSPVTVERRL